MGKSSSVTHEDASSLEKAEQGPRRLSVVIGELPDPDAGKSDEERAAIVCNNNELQLMLTISRTESCYGRSIFISSQCWVYCMLHLCPYFQTLTLQVSPVLPWQNQYWQCSTCWHGKGSQNDRHRLQSLSHNLLHFIRPIRATHQRSP